MSWKTLGAAAPTELVDARLVLHHAAQVVASAGVTYLEPRPDDSHPNLGWAEDLGALMGRTLPGTDAQLGLLVADLSLLLVVGKDRVCDVLELDGRTLVDAYAWLAEAANRARGDLPPRALQRVAYEIPRHAVATGAAFSSTPRDTYAELARWFANGHQVLTELAARTPGTSEVRCWPHHFDLGALSVLATQPDGSLAKSIGIGLSPGDGDYAEPYWYVSPWPYPEKSALPAFESGGHWHTERYTAAILTGSDLLRGPPERQTDRLDAFLDAAVHASQRVLAS